ncbi:hypothetical protein Tco_0270858, partial [Tanacetum coccineum]
HIKIADGGSIQLGDNRTCTIKGTGKVKIQLHDGSSFILEDVRYVSGLKRSLISLDTLEKEGYTVKMQMGRIKVIKGCRVMMTGIRKKNCAYTLEAKGAQGDRKAEIFQVSNDDTAVAQRRLEDKVPGQEGAECNVAEKKKMEESMEANLGKLLKYNAWSTRIHNEKLVHTLLKGHSTLSLEDSLSGDFDVKKNGKWSCIYAVGSQEYQMVCTRLDITSAYVSMLDKFDRGLQTGVQHMKALSTTEAGYMTFTEAWKKEIWLKGL